MPFGFWLFATAALLVAAGAGYGIGVLRTRQRGDAALRSARQEARCAVALQPGWRWQSDAAHVLQRLQPPPGSDVPPHAGGVPVTSEFDGAGLRAALASAAPFTDLRVRRAGDAAGWLLSGRPATDDAGRFAGYVGSARSTADADARAADASALTALRAAADAAEMPLLLARRGTGGDWGLLQASAAARTVLGVDATAAWPAVAERLPRPLRDALAADGDAADADGWLLRRCTDAAGTSMLLLKPPTGAGDADEAAAEAASLSFTVSHDLRAPIRVVEGFTRILQEDYGPRIDRLGNDHLDRVLGAAARMNHMIDALLQVARLSQQPLARQPVNLSQLAAYVVDELRRGTPDRQADIRIEPGLETRGDPTLLRLVLENLLGNAWKYSAKAPRAAISFGTETVDGRRAYVVRDNGAGFDMRSADRLFGLFQRLHSQGEFPGSGVGLASVKRIVRRHGGDIWADAEPGRGAAFHFTLRE